MNKLKTKVTLEEFGNEKIFPIQQLKNWFPSGKFDKRYPQEYLNKWLHTNGKYLRFLGISYKWDNERKCLILTPGNRIGLAPLRNPYGGKIYGSIVVKPRLGWIKIYEILELINWKYQPIFLKNEEPIISDGILPIWFKVIDTLEAIYKALNLFMKGMEHKQIISNIPVGAVNWNNYSKKSVPYGKYNQFDSLITDYSIDLEIHRQFKGITKRIADDISNPKVPIKIKNKAKRLIDTIENKLENVKSAKPDDKRLRKINIPSYYCLAYRKAIQKCIEYLNQSKFSATVGNFYGLPWTLEMDRLFEYWIEYWASIFAKRIAARFYSDIRKNSKIRFYNLAHWKSLSVFKPDIIIEKGSKTMIIEVKYKKHLMYLQYEKYSQETLEEHRHDLHQLLSYMSGSINKRRIGCLIYPKINKKIFDQFATLINYTNARANVDVVLCGVSFQPEDFLTLIENIWSEKYESYA